MTAVIKSCSRGGVEIWGRKLWKDTQRIKNSLFLNVCVCERDRDRENHFFKFVCVCICVHEKERKREGRRMNKRGGGQISGNYGCKKRLKTKSGPQL